MPHAQYSSVWQRCCLLILGVALCAVPEKSARALLVESGASNTTAPSDDPGFIHVGKRAQFSAVYLGNGWVITANHVPVGPVEIDGTAYPEVAGSKVRFDEAGDPADLMAFQIDPAPSLPILEINSDPNLTGESGVMIGYGPDRGAAVTACGTDGYLWGGNAGIRWGTNQIAGYFNVPGTNPIGELTASFYTVFDQGGSSHEAQVVTGNSGGALFVKNGSEWELAGTLFALQNSGACQPPSSALYGNISFIVDLATYRDQIIATVRPECSDEIDNDADGLIDFPADPDCTSREDDYEATVGVPGLGPAGLSALAAALLAGAALPRRRIAPRRPLPARERGGDGPTPQTTPGRAHTRPPPR